MRLDGPDHRALSTEHGTRLTLPGEIGIALCFLDRGVQQSWCSPAMKFTWTTMQFLARLTIDPQLENENDRFVSGLGYLSKYQDLVDTINKASSAEQVRAELAYLLKKLGPAEFFDLDQARKHSEELLESWLSKHKFKNWNETESNKTPITEIERKRPRQENCGNIGQARALAFPRKGDRVAGPSTRRNQAQDR